MSLSILLLQADGSDIATLIPCLFVIGIVIFVLIVTANSKQKALMAAMEAYQSSLVKRTAPAYTNEIGASLGIIPAQSNGISPNDVKPTIEAFASQSGYMFSIVVSSRADADAWAVMIQPKGGVWSHAGTFTGKSADVTCAPAIPGEPVMLNIRVQLMRRNENYGQLSDIVALTVNP